MKKILINVSSIESCIERENACLVKTKTGTLWVCELYVKQAETNLERTYSKIKRALPNELLELPLKEKERE